MEQHLYFAHSGIKGMKWGVRRFRNEDGTLTEAGKRRYGSYVNKEGTLTSKGSEKITSDVRSAESNTVSGSKNIVSGVRQAVNAANRQPRNRYNRRKNLTQEEMDSMSDDDLRKLVNRLNLEQQYSQLTANEGASSKVQVGLEYAEAALSIVGGALTVAAAYKTLRG